MGKILLVRHGNTIAPEGVFAGSIDNPLSELGKEQAGKLAERLAKEPIDRCYASDKIRAIETAQSIIFARKPDDNSSYKHDAILGCNFVIAPELREIHHGRWEGRTKDEVIRDWPDEYAEWEKDPYLFSPEGGEPAIQVVQRVVPFMRKIIQANHGKTALIVSHKATLRLIIAHFMGIPHRLYRELFELDQASLSILMFKNDQQGKLMLYNDTSHYK